MKRVAWVLLALLGACQAQAALQTVNLTCAVVYLPTRNTWVRAVQIDWDRKNIRSLRIDGLTPYGFSTHDHGVLTAIDNERIQIDLRRSIWTSDFRGLAAGRGRCEPTRR